MIKRLLSVFEASFALVVYYVLIEIGYRDLGVVLYTLLLVYFFVKYLLIRQDILNHKDGVGENSKEVLNNLLKINFLLGLLLLFQAVFFVTGKSQVLHFISVVFTLALSLGLVFKALFYRVTKRVINSVDEWGRKTPKLSRQPSIAEYVGFYIGALLLVSVYLYSPAAFLVKVMLLSSGMLLILWALFSFFSQLDSFNSLYKNNPIKSQVLKITAFLFSFLVTAYVYGQLNEITKIEGASFVLTLTATFVLSFVMLSIVIGLLLALLGIVYSPKAKEYSGRINAPVIKQIHWFMESTIPYFSFDKDSKLKSEIRGFLCINYLFTIGFIGGLSGVFLKAPAESVNYFLKKSVYEFDLNTQLYCGSFKSEGALEANYKYAFIDSAKIKFLVYDQELKVKKHGECIGVDEVVIK